MKRAGILALQSNVVYLVLNRLTGTQEQVVDGVVSVAVEGCAWLVQKERGHVGYHRLTWQNVLVWWEDW